MLSYSQLMICGDPAVTKEGSGCTAVCACTRCLLPCLGAAAAAAATPRSSEALEAQLLIDAWEYDLQGGIVRSGWGDEVYEGGAASVAPCNLSF